MSVVVGVLTIDLKANTASFSQSMDKMSSLSAKTANDIKRSLEKIAVAGVAMAGALATGTVAMIKGALDSADAMGKMAQAAGTTVETLSTLNYAAQLSNVATEQLVKGLEKLSVSAFKAQNGNVQLERIFGKLGVTTTDATGKLKDSGILMEQVAVKFAKMGDSSGKTALAVALFGKAGAAMIPMLNQYGAEQEKVNDEAHRFGLVLSSSTVEVAMRAHDNLDRLGLALKGIGFSVLSATLPALDALLEKLINLAKNTDMQGLANAFGQKVTTAVNLLGDALDFATQHAHALKLALEGLAAIQVAKFAIPVIADLAGGGIDKVGAGLSKLVISGLGLSKVMPVLAEFGGWLKYTASFVGLLAAEEGVGAAATYVFGGALAAVGGPIGVAVAAIVGLGVVLYKFRDATFSLGGTAYKLRDTWNAAWIAMGWVFTWIGKEFNTLVGYLKSLWSGLIGFFGNGSVVKVISSVFGEAFAWIQNMLGKLTPQWVTKALDQAKAERLGKVPDAQGVSRGSLLGRPTTKGGPPPPDTSGMGKQTESPVDKVIANLNEKLDEAKQTLAAAGMEEEAQRKVAAANKASNEIMKLGQEIAKQTGATTKDYASLVDASTQALIREKNAQISDIDAKAKLLDIIGAGSRASALSIAQSGLMVEAMDKGSDAILRQASRTQAWNELRTKGGSVAQIQARAEQIYAESIAKESQAVQGNIISLQQELAARQIVNEATLGSLAAQDEAALRAKLYALDVQIAGAAAGELRDKLLALRGAMIALNDEEKLKQDLDNARSLKSPAEQYALEQEKLLGAVDALKKVQGGTISYGQSLQIAMKDQENFNKLIDETVKSLLFEGTAADGMKAFFLDMQKQAITAGQIIYEALHQTFTKLSDNLTQLITGGKTSFAAMFKDIGRQMVNMSIQSGLQKGLGALGKVLPASIGGPLSNALKGKPDGSQNNPFWVQMAAGGGMGGNGGGSQSNPLSVQNVPGVGKGVMGTGITSLGDLFGGKGGDVSGLAVHSPTDLLGGWKPGSGEGEDDGGVTGIGPNGNDSGGDALGGLSGMFGDLKDSLGGIWSKLSSSLGSLMGGIGGILGKVIGGGGGGALSSVFGMLGNLIPHADGGSVSPGSAYLVGERGPEILTGASGNITSNAASRRLLGGSTGDNHYYTIDARGTDPVLTEQRTRAAIIAAHSSAISNSVQVNAERIKRTPQR
jgi:hypothetical protein